MSLAFAALAELQAVAELLGKPLRLPPTSACEHQARTVELPSSLMLLVPDVDALRRKLQAAALGNGLGKLSMQTLRQATAVLWSNPPFLAELPGLLPTLMQVAATAPRLLHALIEAWLRDLKPRSTSFSQAGRDIAALLHDAQHPRLLPWAEAHRRFALFDTGSGPARVCDALLNGQEEVQEICALIGMNDSIRANGGYFRAVFMLLLAALPDALRGHSAVTTWRRAALLLEEDRNARTALGQGRVAKGLRFDSAAMAGITARSCLQCWLDGTASTDAPKAEVRSFLVRMINDPRLFPARWEEAGRDATALMRSWLAAASLEAFFTLISDMTDDKQWQSRQAFWRACLHKMPTAEVWVVLGTSLAQRADTVRDLVGGFGYLDAAGIYANQAVLLIRLGDLVLSEWSNVGPVRAYHATDQKAPLLYQTKRSGYTEGMLKAASLPFPNHPVFGKGGQFNSMGLRHRKPQHGLWQGCAAALLQAKIGLRLTSEDYMHHG